MKTQNIFLKRAMLMASFSVIAPIFAPADPPYNSPAPDGRIIYQSTLCEGQGKRIKNYLQTIG